MKDKRRSEFSQYLMEEGYALFCSKSENARKGIINRLYHQIRLELGWESMPQERWREVSPESVYELIRESGRSTVAMQCFKALMSRISITPEGQRVSTVHMRVRYAVWGEHDPTIPLAIARGHKVMQSENPTVAMAAARGGSSTKEDHILHLPTGEQLHIAKRPTTK
jgi:hypothetical protein